MRKVPTLDIRRFDTDRSSFVADLGAAYREYGFCAISGHGIPKSLIEESYKDFERFFALPSESKFRYHVPGSGGMRGYTPFKVETAKGAELADLKEFYHVGREISRTSRFAANMPPNIWPSEVPSFKEHSYGLFQALDSLGSRVLSALALHINLSEDYFADKTNEGNSILRAIHYPPILQDDIPNVRAGAHEDINFITLLVGASAEGLELLTREGIWLPIITEGDAIVVNIGDMLQRLTNHVYPSTTHRVVNPKNENARKPRYSVPYFLHPNPDVVLDPLPQCITPDNPSRYTTSITSDEYLQERLKEIKLK